MNILKSDAWFLMVLCIAIVTSSIIGSKSSLDHEQALSDVSQTLPRYSYLGLASQAKIVASQWVERNWVVDRYNTLQSEMAMMSMVMAYLAEKQTFTPAGFNQESSMLPNFAAINNTQKKKQTFFEYMLPLVENANREISQDRVLLTELQTKMQKGQSLKAYHRAFLYQLAKRYNISPGDSVEQTLADLLHHVDEIPTSLALAQAANESGWGTSRFAKQANNLFGVWCFSKGCGIVPSDRPEGQSYEVKKYTSVQDSVAAYIHNLNTNPAYADLRARRAQFRADQEDLCGKQLAEGLLKYSIRREIYVKEIQDVILHNKLEICSVTSSV